MTIWGIRISKLSIVHSGGYYRVDPHSCAMYINFAIQVEYILNTFHEYPSHEERGSPVKWKNVHTHLKGIFNIGPYK